MKVEAALSFAICIMVRLLLSCLKTAAKVGEIFT
jgi:hypothetical protein